MQYLELRKVASSRLTLCAAIALLISTLLSLAVIWRMVLYEVIYLFTGSLDAEASEAVMNTRTFFLMIPITVFASLPVISVFMIYTNARSGASMKRTGYTILFVMMVALLILCAVLLPFSLSALSNSHYYFTTCLALLTPFTLLLAFSAASTLKTARDVVINGYTYRNCSVLLPTVLIVSLCLKAANIVALILANSLPILIRLMPEYRVTSRTLFAGMIVAGAADFITTLLFTLISFRGRAALAHRFEDQ
ncbi:MAG: hypothetical protein IJG45_06455 [Oscillospiraceae bacterium]|nr:hypothetical protein [Oscillospiraceae bacterium]